MVRLLNKVRALLQNDRRGVTALEYGLIAAATTFGGSLQTAYTGLGNQVTTQVSAM